VTISFLSTQGKNMRKFVWAGIAVVVLGVAAVYFSADFAAHHPDSWFGRCTALAGYLGSKCNPFAGIGAAVGQRDSCEEGVEQSDNVQVPKPDAVAEDPDGDFHGATEIGEMPDEPIKVEPQPGFIVPMDANDPPQAAAPDETPEPDAGPAEESEAPTDVAAPAHDDLQTTPPAMSYVQDAAPACKKCGICPQGCCDKGVCAKQCTRNGACAKDCCTKNACTKACCNQAKSGKKVHRYVLFGIVFDPDADVTINVMTPCCPVDCCLECCCDWLTSLLGIRDCMKCGGSKPAAAKPSKPARNSSKMDDVPNCQEDPSYSHQYPSCPYTGTPDGVCPCYPSNRHSTTTTPKSNPLDEVMPSEKKVKKPALNSILKLVPESYGSMLDPLFLGVPGTRVISALRAVTGTADEDCDVNQEIDTMEARPTDLDKLPSSETPF
jgi:hypothetical protein